MALLAAALLGSVGCGEPTSAPAPGGDRPLNVLLVSIDTLRADHLGCYGHPEIETPQIDRFAGQGTRFADAVSSAPLTLPSHATMLTGLYPFVHGARDNGVFVVAEGNVTLAERLRAAGYATRAEVAAVVLDSRYGLDQGFDGYGQVERRTPSVRLHAVPPREGDPELEGALGEIVLSQPEIELDRKAEEITRRGIELLREMSAGDEPFFLFLHYFDPHWPHEAPEPFSSHYRDGYYAEIAYVDREFGKLVDALDGLGLADDTLVILTSDHGEGRGQHGEYTHSAFLYDSTLHVPLIVRQPGRIPAGRVVEQQVRLVDVTPTVLDLVGLESGDELQGESLRPLLAEPQGELRLPAYGETLVPKHSFGYSPLRSLRADGWKYVLAPRPELYDLSEDPGEIFNLVRVEPARAARMKGELRAIVAAAAPLVVTGADRQSIDPEELRKLAALGYVSAARVQEAEAGGSELDHFEPAGTNPRDRVELIENWAAGLGAFRSGDYEIAERQFRRFTELEPGIAAGASYLGRTLLLLSREEEAIEMLERAVELAPTSYFDHRVLGNLRAARGESEAAIAAYQSAIEHQPEDVLSRLNLGIVLTSRERFGEALEQFDRALELAPDEPAIHLQRGIGLRLSGRQEEAVASLAEALHLDPRLVAAHAELATARHQLGRTRQAIDGLTEALEALSEEPTLHHRLAELRIAAGDLEAAGRSFARVVELLPGNARARQNLGVNLLVRGQPAAAVGPLRKALELDPELTGALFHLGNALADTGDLAGSETSYRQLVATSPRHAAGHSSLAELLARRGRTAEAIELLRAAHERLPARADLTNDLAWYLATANDAALRNGREAVELAERANERTGGKDFNALDTLAAAYAEVGRFEDAIAAAERALELVRQSGLEAHEPPIAERLARFRARQPYREP